MRRTGARRLAPLVVALLAGTGLLGAGQVAGDAARAVRHPTTALWAPATGTEAVLPARLETAFDRSGLTTPFKHRSLAVLVPTVLLACALARRSTVPGGRPPRPALRWTTVSGRGPPFLYSR
jgi:hypothetical protein